MPVAEQQDPETQIPLFKPVMLARTLVAGVLMGLANLVPGISGGTMVLVMGLYDEFVSSVADVTRLRLSTRSVVFLGLLVGAAGICVVSLAKPVAILTTSHQTPMYSLFIGLTLGGAPLLYGLLKPLRASSVVMTFVGLAVMCVIAATDQGNGHRQEPDSDGGTTIVVQPAYARDTLAGALGMSAMVLPGISGAYMLLVLGRYETIYIAVGGIKDAVLSEHSLGDPAYMQVIIPVAVGAIISLVLLSNVLKWLLHHKKNPTLGFLLGILLGSVVGIWPFTGQSGAGDYGLGLALAVIGFTITFFLSRLSKTPPACQVSRH